MTRLAASWCILSAGVKSFFRVAGGSDEVLQYLIAATQRTRGRDRNLLESLIELTPLRCQTCHIQKSLDDGLDRRMGQAVEIEPTACPAQECQGFLCRACTLARRRTFAMVDVGAWDREQRLAGMPREPIPAWRCMFHAQGP